MKLKYKVESKNLCANCAAKIEEAIKKMEGVNDANLSFMTDKLKLEVDEDVDPKEILVEANKIADKLEPGTVFVEK